MRPTTRAAIAATATFAAGLATIALPASAGTAVAAGPRDTMRAYAADTYRSMDAMVDQRTELVADNIKGDLGASSRSGYTSPTNIGAYLWSTVAARDIGVLSRRQAHARLSRTLDAIGGLERHADSGMFFNWYSPADGSKLRIWPDDGSTVEPFLSSVDNGWMAAALMVTRNADPSLSRQADRLLAPMDFGFFYDPTAANSGGAGLLRGGFWDERPTGCSVEGNLRSRGPNVFYTCHYYGNFVSEPRIASYLGIALGQIPAQHYFGPARTFPPTCDWSWQEQKPVGDTKNYLGVDVFEGAYRYRGLQLVPTWGGDMFEALMPDLFVPEADWGKKSFGVNHPLTVEAQIRHGMDEAGYGYWGFSPASNPAGGYREYGVDEIGLDTNGYTSDQERTSVDRGYAGCPERTAAPQPTFGDGVVTPHASFLALPYAQQAALANLAKMRRNFDAYGPGGFYDAVAVRSGTVAKRYLSLDQGMIMGALGNVLAGGDLHRYFTRGAVTRVLKPVMRLEEFNARRLPAGG
jgi:Putative glucoamylase